MPIKDSGKSQTPVYLWLTIAQMYLISKYFLFLMKILKWLQTSVLGTWRTVTVVLVIDEKTDPGHEPTPLSVNKGYKRYRRRKGPQYHWFHSQPKGSVSMIPYDWNKDCLETWEDPSSNVLHTGSLPACFSSEVQVTRNIFTPNLKHQCSAVHLFCHARGLLQSSHCP